MRIRPSILAIAGCLALGPALAAAAIAKPPEDEIADRAERAAERAARAAERAAEAADRAAERGDKDRGRDRTSDRTTRGNGNDDHQGDGDGRAVGSSRGSGGEVQLATNGEDGADNLGASDQVAGGVEEGPSTSGSNSHDRGADEGEALDDPDYQDNSGSGNDDDRPDGAEVGTSDSENDSDSDEDNSGSGSNGDDPDDEEDDEGDDDNQDDRSRAYARLENDHNGSPFREGELVVMSDDAAILQRAEALGFAVIEERQLSVIGSVVATLRRPEGVTSAQALELLQAREPTSPSGYNYVYRSTAPSRDAPFEEQGRSGLALTLVGTIGVMDGFSRDTIEGWTVERLVSHPAGLAHGDIVAGILLEDLAEGFGSKPGKLLLMDVMEADGNAGSADVAALVFGLDRLTAAGARVVNLSLAGPDHAALRLAVNETVRRGVTLVAAVGNAGPAAPPFYPAAYDGVVGVSAVDSSGKPYIYSGRGPHVDIAALGEITTVSRGAGQAIGTSYAAPHVTALLAGKENSGASVDELLSRHANDVGAPGRDQVFGVGVLSSYSHTYVFAGQPTK